MSNLWYSEYEKLSLINQTKHIAWLALLYLFYKWWGLSLTPFLELFRCIGFFRIGSFGDSRSSRHFRTRSLLPVYDIESRFCFLYFWALITRVPNPVNTILTAPLLISCRITYMSNSWAVKRTPKAKEHMHIFTLTLRTLPYIKFPASSSYDPKSYFLKKFDLSYFIRN